MTNCRATLFAITFFVSLAATARAQTGTFLDRHDPGDLRVVTYNVLADSIFPEVDPVQAAKFDRVVTALQPDVLNLQEIFSFGEPQIVALLNDIVPLPGGATWHAHQAGDNVIASRYPLSLTAVDTIPESDPTALALVDLPDDRFSADLYVLNNHFKCCTQSVPPTPLDGFEQARQYEADALVNWLRDARTPGGNIDLPANTPLLIAGDLNIVAPPNVLDPLGTLLSGDIYFEGAFGPDSPPDWDGTSFADAHPLHNGTGPADYTWRNDFSQFDPGRLDYILYSDSVLTAANSFVLNTVDMSPAELAATGLQPFDITVDRSGNRFDHLPVVTDFRLVPEPTSAALAITMITFGVCSPRRRANRRMTQKCHRVFSISRSAAHETATRRTIDKTTS